MNTMEETTVQTIGADPYSDRNADMDDDTRCEQCHIHPKDKTDSEYSILCTQCREEYIRLHVPAIVILFFVILGVIFAGAMIHMPKTVERYKIYLAAEKHIDANEYLFAYEDFSALLNVYDDSVPLILDTADAAMNAQLFNDAADIIDENLVGKTLNERQYEHATLTTEKLGRFFNSVYAINQIFDEADPDTASVDKLFSQVIELLENPENDKALLYLYLGNLSSTMEESIDYFRMACEVDEQFTYPLSTYGNALRRAQRFDDAQAACQDAVSKNACDSSSISGLGILELLNGDKAEGLSLIQQAYAIDPDCVYVPEALVIALCENGQRDAALDMVNKKAEQYLFDPELQDYLDGTIDLQQYYID